MVIIWTFLALAVLGFVGFIATQNVSQPGAAARHATRIQLQAEFTGVSAQLRGCVLAYPAGNSGTAFHRAWPAGGTSVSGWAEGSTAFAGGDLGGLKPLSELSCPGSGQPLFGPASPTGTPAPNAPGYAWGYANGPRGVVLAVVALNPSPMDADVTNGLQAFAQASGTVCGVEAATHPMQFAASVLCLLKEPA